MRKAVNKYTSNLEQSNPDQHTKRRDYHGEYSKLYYKKLRESHIMFEKMNGTHDFLGVYFQILIQIYIKIKNYINLYKL